MTDIGSTVMQGVALGAEVWTTGMRIEEARRDYAHNIANMKEAKAARLAAAEGEIVRGKETGIAALSERGAQAAYETNVAMRKAEQTASSAEARIGASGVRASGTALAAAQQETDIAYAGAQRIAEAGTAQMKIGGLQLKNQLVGGREQKSLLTMEYQQRITEAQRKKTELEENTVAMLFQVGLGGLAGLSSSFYKLGENRDWWE